MSQYEERLQHDIDEIRQALGQLASAVEQAFSDAQRVFLNCDRDLAYATVLADNHINRESVRVERMTHEFIARHAPSAGHLRLMSSMLRVSVALERIGDYAVTICREAMQMRRPPEPNVAREVAALSDESQRLLHQAVTAFLAGDEPGARALMPLTSHFARCDARHL